MREIKFRAWDKDGNWMAPFHGRLDDLPKSMVLMQFTGLKDKNGKECFEGDIVRMTFNGKTNDGDVEIRPTQGVVVGGRPIWPHDFEIIGNKYENGSN